MRWEETSKHFGCRRLTASSLHLVPEKSAVDRKVAAKHKKLSQSRADAIKVIDEIPGKQRVLSTPNASALNLDDEFDWTPHAHIRRPARSGRSHQRRHRRQFGGLDVQHSVSQRKDLADVLRRPFKHI